MSRKASAPRTSRSKLAAESYGCDYRRKRSNEQLGVLRPIESSRRRRPQPRWHRAIRTNSWKEYTMKKLSARNQLKGKIVEVKKGATTSHVRIDIGNGIVITSSITNEAVADLNLKTGDEAWAVIKASDVMIGV